MYVYNNSLLSFFGASGPLFTSYSEALNHEAFYLNYPRGSKDPNNKVLGPKYYTINGIWALKPYDLGPWTLRVPV